MTDIDIEKIDPYGEEDWNEKDIIFLKYYYKFNDILRKIEVTDKIFPGGDTIEIEDTNESTNEYFILRNIQKYLNTKIRDLGRCITMYRELNGNLRIKSKFFKLRLNKYLFINDNNLSNYFLNPFKQYTIRINKNSFKIKMNSRYKITLKKNNFILNENKNYIHLIFNYRNSKKALESLNNTYNNYIKNKIKEISENQRILTMRKNYRLDIKE